MNRPRYAVAPPQVMQGAGPLSALTDLAKKKGMNYAIDAAVPGGGLMAEAAQVALPTLFNKGGEVSKKVDAYMLWLKNNPKAMEGLNKAKDTKPQYKEMGGMTPGPLGMSDMLAAGRGKDVSKVTYKKKGGEIEDVMEISYHAPLAGKPSE